MLLGDFRDGARCRSRSVQIPLKIFCRETRLYGRENEVQSMTQDRSEQNQSLSLTFENERRRLLVAVPGPEARVSPLPHPPSRAASSLRVPGPALTAAASLAPSRCHELPPLVRGYDFAGRANYCHCGLANNWAHERWHSRDPRLEELETEKD